MSRSGGATDGREIYELAPTSDPPKGSGLLVDRGGSSYTALWPSNDDRRTMLFRRTAQGRADLLFGDSRAAARFRQIIVASVGGMAFAADGALLFGDGMVLRRVAADGAASEIFRGEPGTNIRGLSVGADGMVYAADIGRRLVVAIGRDGKSGIVHRSASGWTSSGVAFGAGRLLVLEAELDPTIARTECGSSRSSGGKRG